MTRISNSSDHAPRDSDGVSSRRDVESLAERDEHNEQPTQRSIRLHRWLIVLGPIGLAIDIWLSLWVSQLHVETSAIIQVDPAWQPGQMAAVRTQLVDYDRTGIENVPADLVLVSSNGNRHPLPSLQPIIGNGVSQATFVVPELQPGNYSLETSFVREGLHRVIEAVPIHIDDKAKVRKGKATIASSTAQWVDDTDKQTSPWKIDLLPFGRTLAGFHNRFMVRVTNKEGAPYQGPVEISLLSGEFAGEVGDEQTPVVLFTGDTTRLGLATVSGELHTEVVRFTVEIDPRKFQRAKPEPTIETKANEPAPLLPKDATTRRSFFVASFAGGARIITPQLAVKQGEALDIAVHRLRAKRHTHIDVHGPNGRWKEAAVANGPTADDKVLHWNWHAPALPATATPTESLVYQLEAYPYTNAPGESTTLARVQVVPGSPTVPLTLVPLINKQRENLNVQRVSKTFDKSHEEKYLAHLERLARLTQTSTILPLAATEVQQARQWLLGTLPVRVFGTPLAINTREREIKALETLKLKWIMYLRWFLLGGGSLFVSVLSVNLWQNHTRTVRAMNRQFELGGFDDEERREAAQSSRVLALRGLVVIAILAMSLLLAMILLESLVWVNPAA